MTTSRPWRLSAPWLLLLVALGSSPAAGLECPTEMEHEVVRLINRERAAVGLAPVEIDLRLTEAARRHSDDMAEHQFLSHTGSDGSRPGERVADAGYPLSAAETAGAGQATAAAIVDGWMNSPGHRAILLGASWRHVGVAYAATSWFYRHVWTANFGAATELVSIDDCGAPAQEPLGRPGRPYVIP